MNETICRNEVYAWNSILPLNNVLNLRYCLNVTNDGNRSLLLSSGLWKTPNVRTVIATIVRPSYCSNTAADNNDVYGLGYL